jgi:hypothetical protein
MILGTVIPGDYYAAGQTAGEGNCTVVVKCWKMKQRWFGVEGSETGASTVLYAPTQADCDISHGSPLIGNVC